MTIRDAAAAALGPAEIEEPIDVDEVRPEPAPGSMLAIVRQRAEALSHEQTVELALPGYSDVLWGRYRAISIAKAIGAETINPLMPEWRVAADALSRALIGLYGRGPDGELASLQIGVETRFDDELVDMLDLQPTERTARGVLVALLGGGELGESRVTAHFMAYQGWLLAGERGAENELAGRAVGEFPAR